MFGISGLGFRVLIYNPELMNRETIFGRSFGRWNYKSGYLINLIVVTARQTVKPSFEYFLYLWQNTKLWFTKSAGPQRRF